MSLTAAQCNNSAAVRHVVYRDLLSLLPIASVDQATQFAVNLALCRPVLNDVPATADVISNFSREWYIKTLTDKSANVIFQTEIVSRREKAIHGVIAKLRNLRVTPDLAEVDSFRGLSRSQIENRLNDKYGERLADIAGFYRHEGRKDFFLNLPERCALFGYRSHIGFYNGVLCQPLDSIDKFFLLSSRGQGGVSALRIDGRDRDLVERFKEPVTSAITTPSNQADLSGYRWNGRRFVQRNK